MLFRSIDQRTAPLWSQHELLACRTRSTGEISLFLGECNRLYSRCSPEGHLSMIFQQRLTVQFREKGTCIHPAKPLGDGIVLNLERPAHPFLNPHLLEQRFWSLPPFCFHWDTTHAAASLPGRGVWILKQLLCFKRVNRAHRVRHLFGTAHWITL